MGELEKSKVVSIDKLKKCKIEKLVAVVVQISCIVSSIITVYFYCSNPTTLSDLSLVLYNSCYENPLVELILVQTIVPLCILAIVLVFGSVDPSFVLDCDIGLLDLNSSSLYGL
jgi:hypothetical protein